MENPFAKPRCEHGIRAGDHCPHCGPYGRRALAKNWLWDEWGLSFIGAALSFGIIIGSVLTLIFTLIFTVGGTASYVLGSKQCSRYELISGADTDYSFLGGGCFVETEDGNWVTLATYKNQTNIKIR